MPQYNWLARSISARKASHNALAKHDGATSRIVVLEDLLKGLSGAPIDVQDYFGEAITCLEHGLFRSGIVLAWAGQFDVYSEMLFAKHEPDIRASRKKWVFSDLSDLKENYPEAQLLDVGKEVGFIKRPVLRMLQGHLSTRNQSAHPTLYRPSMNSAIGYVDEMIQHTLNYIPPTLK